MQRDYLVVAWRRRQVQYVVRRDDMLPRGRNAPPVRKKRVIKSNSSPSGVALPTSAPEPVSAIKVPEFILVWESRELTERDLNIPSGGKTNATGALYFKKGSMENIDQRHFFREQIFHDLPWTRDVRATKTHFERSEASFRLLVKGLDYGTYRLKLSHDTKTDSTSYEQGNEMTKVHWGDAKTIIAKQDLIGRIMSLYRKEGDPPGFLIEID